jgi:nucleoside-diphosphate-sugar epimerase
LKADFLARFSTVLWFAGHSSVGQCAADPSGALRNNCLDLVEFAALLKPTVQLIYASSASVYSTATRTDGDKGKPLSSSESAPLAPALTPYDATKSSFDSIASNFFHNTTGLRMGTVCGWSERLRPELVFNAMVISAVQRGEVLMANERARRSLLFLDDLKMVIETLVQKTTNGEQLPRILNCASVNTSMGELANNIAGTFGVEVKRLPDSPTYDFSLDCTQMSGLVPNLPTRDVAHEAREFAKRLEES